MLLCCYVVRCTSSRLPKLLLYRAGHGGQGGGTSGEGEQVDGQLDRYYGVLSFKSDLAEMAMITGEL
jgi:hypothetical protein